MWVLQHGTKSQCHEGIQSQKYLPPSSAVIYLICMCSFSDHPTKELLESCLGARPGGLCSISLYR